MVIHEGTKEKCKNTPVFDLFQEPISAERENIPPEEVQILKRMKLHQGSGKKRILPIFYYVPFRKHFRLQENKRNAIATLFGGVRRELDKTTSRET